MQKKHLPVAIEILEHYAREFRNLFQETMKETFPADYELNHSCFEKNDLYLKLRDFIKARGKNKVFNYGAVIFVPGKARRMRIAKAT